MYAIFACSVLIGGTVVSSAFIDGAFVSGTFAGNRIACNRIVGNAMPHRRRAVIDSEITVRELSARGIPGEPSFSVTACSGCA